METPNSSVRRVTRSQTAASSNKNISISKLIEDSEQTLLKSRKQPQESNKKSSPLLDITNNSPIVGIAMGSLLTPSSSVAKKRTNRVKVTTPGSGEALLRNQVKSLMQKVEEEAELSKISLGTRPIFPYLQGFVNSSPMGLLLAPTPANTPQVQDESTKSDVDGSVTSSLNPNQELISQVVNEIFDGEKYEEESLGSEKSLITRSLLLDFSEKSEVTDASDCSSVLTSAKDKSFTDEDSSSVWSIQVNAASTRSEDFKEEEEEEEQEEETEDYNEQEEYNDEEEEEYEEGSLEELCSGIERMSILAAKFEGKHTRFVYNSDDEIVEAVEELGSPSIVKLKGLPTPKGKHMRFPLEE